MTKESNFMNDILVIDNLDQLKCVSDPFRIQLLSILGDEPKTGQQIADILEIPRAKIHYHLAELEKNGIIELVKTEQKHSIIQKFYLPVAKKLVPSHELLRYRDDEKKKDRLSYPLKINEDNLDSFKKDLKKLVKKASTKKGEEEFIVQVMPLSDSDEN